MDNENYSWLQIWDPDLDPDSSVHTESGLGTNHSVGGGGEKKISALRARQNHASLRNREYGRRTNIIMQVSK